MLSGVNRFLSDLFCILFVFHCTACENVFTSFCIRGTEFGNSYLHLLITLTASFLNHIFFPLLVLWAFLALNGEEFVGSHFCHFSTEDSLPWRNAFISSCFHNYYFWEFVYWLVRTVNIQVLRFYLV